MGSPTTHCMLGLALLVLSAPALTSAAKCNANEFYCVTPSIYQFCLDGSTSTNSEALFCPAGTRCTNDCYEPCLPVDLTPCVRCHENKTFRCVDNKSFQLCSEGDIPDPEVRTCESTFVCSKYCDFECSPEACPPVKCVADGRMANPENPKKYYLCQKVGDKFVIQEYTCTGEAKFDNSTLRCISTTTTTSTTLRPAFVCSGVGRFPDPLNVAGYVVCTLDPVKGYVGAYFPCPYGTVYNSTTRKCTSSPTTPSVPFKCTAEGRFPVPGSCTDYIMCSKSNAAGEFVSAHYSCPANSYFDPATGRCSATRPDSCEVSARTLLGPEFECSDTGRFQDPESGLHYYLCTEDADGDDDLEVYRFPCPDESCFNPDTKKCTYMKSVCA